MLFSIVFAIYSIGAAHGRPGLWEPLLGAEGLPNETAPRINNNLTDKKKPDIVKVDDVCSWDGNLGCSALCVEWGYWEGECDDFNDCVCYSRNSLLSNNTSAESSEEQDETTAGITVGVSVTTAGPSPTIYTSTTTSTIKDTFATTAASSISYNATQSIPYKH